MSVFLNMDGTAQSRPNDFVKNPEAELADSPELCPSGSMHECAPGKTVFGASKASDGVFQWCQYGTNRESYSEIPPKNLTNGALRCILIPEALRSVRRNRKRCGMRAGSCFPGLPLFCRLQRSALRRIGNGDEANVVVRGSAAEFQWIRGKKFPIRV